MERQKDLISILDHIKTSPKILVIGDLMLDRYTYGNTDRISQEAPVLVLKTDHCEHRLGGAASVCHMLAELNASVGVAGVVGNDREGRTIVDLLEKIHVKTDAIHVDDSRPSTVKDRFVGRSGSGLPSQILRVDSESTQPISREIENRFIRHFHDHLPDYDVVLISDYDKGVCTARLIASVIESARKLNVPVLVDPGRHRDYSVFADVSLIKPNRSEAEAACHLQIRTGSEALQAGKKICESHGISMAVITLDSDGVCLVDRTGNGELYPTMARSVYDITGAGDMVLAILGICFASDLTPQESVRLANFAAGMEVDRTGVATLRRDELRFEFRRSVGQLSRKQFPTTEARRIGDEHRRASKSIVFTNGCFDLLHVGHVTYLEEAAALGDVLIVGVNSDASVSRLKGPERPIINESDRVAMLTSLACVDHVVIFDCDTPCELLREIRPDVLVKGGTYTREQVIGHEIVEEYGGRIVVTQLVGGVSTTKIVESVGGESRLQRAG